MTTKSRMSELIPLCKEFKPNIDTNVTFDIESHGTTFHIHPQLLTNNFRQIRNQFNERIQKKLLLISSFEKFKCLYQEPVPFVMEHFGIHKIKFKNKCLEECTIDLYESKNNSWNDWRSDSQLDKFLQSTLFSQLIELRAFKTKKDNIKNKYGVCKHMLQLGCFISCFSDHIKRIFNNLSASKLRKCLTSYINKQKNGQILDNTQYIMVSEASKYITNNGINGILSELQSILSNKPDALKQFGHNCAQSALNNIQNNYFNGNHCIVCNYRNKAPINCKYILDITQLMDTSILSSAGIDYSYCKTWSVIRICVLNCLYDRVKELQNLAMKCHIHGELIALKLMKCAYKLSKGYIEICDNEEKWNHNKYEQLIDEYKNVWLNIECNNCGFKNNVNEIIKMKVCHGCMMIAYCSKRCQKNDWTKQHRSVCNKSWVSLYRALKMTVFDRM